MEVSDRTAEIIGLLLVIALAFTFPFLLVLGVIGWTIFFVCKLSDKNN